MADIEPLEDFRQRARSFAAGQLAPMRPDSAMSLRALHSDAEELALVRRDRELQRMFYDAGLAGIVVPTDYGGQGLTPAHQRILNEELHGKEHPHRFQVPTFTPCMAVLLDFASEEIKRRHVRAMLRGDELWMQFLSEPSGGSDVAGALTTAQRDGDEWIINGSKVWTTGAWWSDWGLCLARTNLDVPKHRGLSVFIIPIDSDGIEVQRIEMLNGNMDFCQEYLDDLRIPDSFRVGAVDDGWTVGSRWMTHERMQANSPYVTRPAGIEFAQVDGATMARIAADTGRADDPAARELVGEAETLDLVTRALERRIGQGLAGGALSGQESAIARLFHGSSTIRRHTIGFELAGSVGGAWLDDLDGEAAPAGEDFLMRQAGAIGGGTLEMSQNVIAERVLGMPRERSGDKDLAFRDVPRSPTGPPGPNSPNRPGRPGGT